MLTSASTKDRSTMAIPSRIFASVSLPLPWRVLKALSRPSCRDWNIEIPEFNGRKGLLGLGYNPN